MSESTPSFAIRFRIDRLDGSDPSDLLDDVSEYLSDSGYEVLAVEYGPNWFGMRVERPADVEDEELSFALARDLASGFPHSGLIGAVVDDVGRTLYPRPELQFDA